ncbi:MAG: DUF4422 domain-containing protein [Selenomonas sp.]|nr:DUF4422 domain-containing protein [Selenomonas sp.]
MSTTSQKKEKTIKIFVSHRIDLDSYVVENDVFYPVRCGAVYDDRPDVFLPGDDTGDNISEKRETLCEFTVLYWAWKNVDADYYGLCHYRRYPSFSFSELDEDIYQNVVRENLDDKAVKELHLDDIDQIHDIIENVDYAYTVCDVSKAGFRDLYDHYEQSLDTLHSSDIYKALGVVRKMSPELYPYFKRHLSGTNLIPCNMLVMKKELFQNMCEWLFPILFELEKQLSNDTYCLEEIRVPAHIGERLVGAYIEYLNENPALSSTILQRVFFVQTIGTASRIPPLKVDSVPVVLTSSSYYVPYLATELKSILLNHCGNVTFDFLILHTDIEKNVQDMLLKDFREFENAHIRFINVTSYFSNKNFDLVLSHLAVQTFYRLCIAEILKEYSKVVFLDCDLIVEGDLADFYAMDLQGYCLGATHDADAVGEYNGFMPHVKPYFDGELHLEHPYDYFQCGVLLMNLDEIRHSGITSKELISYASNKHVLFADQDVLNVFFAGKVKFIDMSWNVLTDCDRMRNKIIKRGPVRFYKTYAEARKHPNIIHYAGDEKPWDNPLMDFASHYFKYARQSLFYEEIMTRMALSRVTMVNGSTNAQLVCGEDPYNRFSFPWRSVRPGSRIVLYGGGVVGKMFLRQLANNPYCHVVAVCDQNPAATGIREAPVIDVRQLCDLDPDFYDLVLIDLERKDIATAIRADLELSGIPPQKIKWVDPHRR